MILAWASPFKYLCYVCMAININFNLLVRGLTLDVRIWRLRTSDSDV